MESAAVSETLIGVQI